MNNMVITLHIVLLEPEIPPNTGNLIRLAANTGCHLHLIEPLGFILDDKRVKRAGLDYHELAYVHTHQNFAAFLTRENPQRLFAASSKATVRYSDMQYQNHDYFLFGPETRGLPQTIREHPAITSQITIPMKAPSRSLNLANSAAIILYEAIRQLDFVF